MCHSAAYSCSDGAAHCLAAVRRHTSPAPVHRNAVHSTNSSVKCANAAAAAYALRAAHSRSAQHAVRRGALYDRLAREPQPAARPSTAVPPPHQSQVCLTVSQTFGNSRCAGGHCWWCGWVSARGSAEGRMGQRGSALRSCTACRNSVEPKANGTLFNCEWIGRHGLAWPGAHACTRSHQHAGTSAHARSHTHAHARQTCWSQCRWGGSARAHTPRRAQHSDCPVATNATNAALAPNQSAGVVDELDEPLPRLPCDAWSTPRRPRKGSPRRWPVASQ